MPSSAPMEEDLVIIFVLFSFTWYIDPLPPTTHIGCLKKTQPFWTLISWRWLDQINWPFSILFSRYCQTIDLTEPSLRYSRWKRWRFLRHPLHTYMQTLLVHKIVKCIDAKIHSHYTYSQRDEIIFIFLCTVQWQA